MVEELHSPPGLAAPFVGECRYLISLDFDGTLFCEHERRIPLAFFEKMRQWRSYGVRWGINTGRSLPYLLQDLRPHAVFLPDFICTCERYIYMADDVGRLVPDTAHNALCVIQNNAVRERFAPVLRHAMQGVLHVHPEWQWEFAADDPLSIEAADAATMDAMAPMLQQLIAADSSLSFQRAGRYMRFADARYDKGTALAHIAKRWGVPGNRMAILGDGHNDLHAFCAMQAAFCAAPANAHPEVCAWLRAHGGYLSPEPGVLQALQFWAEQCFLNAGGEVSPVPHNLNSLL